MIADRISLKHIYDTLFSIEKIEGKVSAIRIKRKNAFGTTRSVPRFDNIADLRKYMNKLYPFKRIGNATDDCFAHNEGIFILTSFEVNKNGRQNTVYNYEIEFKTSVKNLINRLGLQQLNRINVLAKELQILVDNYILSLIHI